MSNTTTRIATVEGKMVLITKSEGLRYSEKFNRNVKRTKYYAAYGNYSSRTHNTESAAIKDLFKIMKKNS